MHFSKMHGCGNDFVIVDRRGRSALSDERVAAMADRHRGIGFDQLLEVFEGTAGAVLRYAIRNSDGSSASQCGNGARCLGAWAVRAGLAPGSGDFWMHSPAGPVECLALSDGRFAVVLDTAADSTLTAAPAPVTALEPMLADLGIAVVAAVGVGNSHLVLRSGGPVTALPLEKIAAELRSASPDAADLNIGIAFVEGRGSIALRVDERGAGPTLACGSGACAAVLALAETGAVDREVKVHMPGGAVEVALRDDGRISLTGPIAFSFEGEWPA